LASKIELLRAVASAVGDTPPQDENEGTPFLLQILPIWDSIVSDFTTRHAWTWGTQLRVISATTVEPPAPWEYTFALPVDRTLLRDVFDENGEGVDYDLEDGDVYAMLPGPLYARINVAADAGVWPGDFAKIVQDTLEGYSWKGLRDEKQIGANMIANAEARLVAVIARDRNQKPRQKLNRGTVFRAFKGTLTRRKPLDG
jgi:hypothetical protein